MLATIKDSEIKFWDKTYRLSDSCKIRKAALSHNRKFLALIGKHDISFSVYNGSRDNIYVINTFTGRCIRKINNITAELGVQEITSIVPDCSWYQYNEPDHNIEEISFTADDLLLIITVKTPPCFYFWKFLTGTVRKIDIEHYPGIVSKFIDFPLGKFIRETFYYVRSRDSLKKINQTGKILTEINFKPYYLYEYQILPDDSVMTFEISYHENLFRASIYSADLRLIKISKQMLVNVRSTINLSFSENEIIIDNLGSFNIYTWERTKEFSDKPRNFIFSRSTYQTLMLEIYHLLPIIRTLHSLKRQILNLVSDIIYELIFRLMKPVFFEENIRKIVYYLVEYTHERKKFKNRKILEEEIYRFL